MKRETKRTVAVATGSAVFSAAFISAPDLLPWLDPTGWLPGADSTPMLVTVGLAAPAGMGYVVWLLLSYYSERLDLRVRREVQPERVLKGSLQ